MYDKHAFTLPPLVLPSFCPAAIKKFILVPLHTDPNQAVQEIDRLHDVFVEVSKKWDNTVRRRDVID